MAAALMTNTEILEEKRKRLAVLERQAARMGYSTPAEVVTEIALLRGEVAAKGALASFDSTVESYGILYDLIKNANERIDGLYTRMPLWMLGCTLVIVCAVVGAMLLAK
jgi:hypothetical protein